MKRRLRVLLEAEQELAEAAQWYEGRRIGLGVELMASIDRALETIVDEPKAYPAWRKGHPYRKHVLRRFPYIVFFKLVADDIEVVAFAHAKRKPGYWQERSR